MYTHDLNNLFKLFEADLPNWKTTSTYPKSSIDYVVGELENGKQELTLSVLGHNPKDIKLEVTEDKIVIKEEVKKGEPDFKSVSELDLSKIEKFITALPNMRYLNRRGLQRITWEKTAIRTEL